MTQIPLQLPLTTPPTLTRITESKVQGGEITKAQGSQDIARTEQADHSGVVAGHDALTKAVESLQKFLDIAAREKFTLAVDKESGRSVVRVIDADTGKTVRQFPPEEILNLAKNMRENNGLLLTITA